MTRDMTSGSPLKLITAFCIPLIFGTLFQQFYSMVDSIYLSIGIAAILRSIGDSKTPVYALVASAIINIVLDLLFVAVFHMGVPGVAIATVIAQGVSGGVCFYYMFKKYDNSGQSGCVAGCGHFIGQCLYLYPPDSAGSP